MEAVGLDALDSPSYPELGSNMGRGWPSGKTRSGVGLSRNASELEAARQRLAAPPRPLHLQSALKGLGLRWQVIWPSNIPRKSAGEYPSRRFSLGRLPPWQTDRPGSRLPPRPS